MASYLLLLLACLSLTLISAVCGEQVGIVNGTVVKGNTRPYMVSVQYGNKHFCGGFLISEYFVMTAAHCIKWGVNLTVVMGQNDLTKLKDALRIPVKFYHINPGYVRATLHNDIGLLQLAERVKMSNSVKYIALPKKDADIKENSVCSISGWGAMRTGGLATNQLQEANVLVRKTKECKAYWENFYKRMLCATGGAGFCQGDSGGPLVCKDKAVGVVSFNQRNNCNKPSKPNVYTRISAYLPWINTILKSVQN